MVALDRPRCHLANDKKSYMRFIYIRLTQKRTLVHSHALIYTQVNLQAHTVYMYRQAQNKIYTHAHTHFVEEITKINLTLDDEREERKRLR